MQIIMSEKFANLNSRIISPENANKHDDFSCPRCGNNVILCDGEFRKYFRHRNMEECNFYGSESDLHFDAKLRLKEILLNEELLVSRKCCNCARVEYFNNPIFENVELEYSFADDNRSADVAAFQANIMTIFEVFNTHKTSELDRPEPWFELSANEIFNYYGEIKCHRKRFCDDCIGEAGKGKISINQRGAGCGKTYESIQLLANNTMHKNTFIYMTKMHTAKDVIMNELVEQERDGKLNNLKIELLRDNTGKQYVINFVKDNRENTIIIGTVDSFLYALADKNKLIESSGDYFENVRSAIIDGKLNITRDFTAKYAGKDISLRDNTLLILDEAQDLPVSYIHTFDSILQRTSTDMYMIGDKLQSIWFEDNIYSYAFSEYCNLKTRVEKNVGENIIRRFHNKKHSKFVNRIVRFKDFNMKEISGVCKDVDCKINHNDRGIGYFLVEPILGDHNDANKIDKCIDDIISMMDKHQDMLPGDFMMIFPTIANNPIASRLEDRLNEYWSRNTTNEYQRYAFLHKSEEGQPIDIKDSEGMTRLVSIHASKGNGAKVVFLVGISEYILKLFSGGEINIRYESLLHVALTRHKQYLYLGMSYNPDDDIIRRIGESKLSVEMNIGSISGMVKYNKVSQWISSKTFSEYSDSLILPNTNLLDKIKENFNGIIEWNYHIIRNCSLLLNFRLCILKDYRVSRNDENNEISRYSNPTYQSLRALHSIVYEQTDYKNYIRLLKEINNINNHNSKVRNSADEDKEYMKQEIIPILRHENISFTNKLMRLIETIKGKILRATECGTNEPGQPLKSINHDEQKKAFRKLKFCPLESVIVVMLTDIAKRGIFTSYTFSELYHLIFAFAECYKYNNSAKHSDEFSCACDEVFAVGEILTGESKYKGLYCHHMDTRRVGEIYRNYSRLEEIHEIRHKLKYESSVNRTISNNSIILSARDELIATYDNLLVLFIFKPEVNKLCFNDLLLNCMVKNFIYNKCGNRNLKIETVIIYIITLSSIVPLRVVVPMDDLLRRDISDSLFDTLSRNHDSVFNIYKIREERYIRNGDAIMSILADIKDARSSFPNYIKDFFEELRLLSVSRTRGMLVVLEELLERDNFIRTLNEKLIDTINDLLH
jgi:predicted RNA-binding Zn-ribbon protein involved in translation (DUF1610 family)